MIFDWPDALIPQDLAILPPRKTVGLNTSLTQFAQSVPAIRPPFGLKLVFGNLFDAEVHAWRAMMALFEGRANQVRIPLFDLWHGAQNTLSASQFATHSDGLSFSDGTTYETPDLFGVTMHGEQGQRTFDVNFNQYGQILQAGQFFGLGDCPYIARRVWWNGTRATIEAAPSLRFIYDDEPVKLKPTMIAGLIDDDQGELMLQRARYGATTLELVERFDVLLP